MTRMLVAGVLSVILVIGLGPWFVVWLRRKEFGQNIREDGPQRHIALKAGTPTMGGLLILTAMTIPFLLVGKHSGYGASVWLTMMACAAIGFWDDWMKISNRRSLGLSGRWTMVARGVVACVLFAACREWLGISTALEIPLTHHKVDLSYGYLVLLFFAVVGASNAVNLTDGLDGLAAGTVVISLMAFIGIAFIQWDRRVGEIGIKGSLDLAVFAAALAGACVGFLWYNSHPAQVFMGDTGSMGLGGALAALAVVTKTELLLVIIGGIFVVEALSVIMQVASFKRTGKRIFLMAPIHHHFELKEWSETQIMVRFWIVAGLFSATGFTIWFHTH
jgi:phospho-N-acetylmuramoyl-pentapeptide-transferase